VLKDVHALQNCKFSVLLLTGHIIIILNRHLRFLLFPLPIGAGVRSESIRLVLTGDPTRIEKNKKQHVSNWSSSRITYMLFFILLEPGWVTPPTETIDVTVVPITLLSDGRPFGHHSLGGVPQMGRVSKLSSFSSNNKILRKQSPLAPKLQSFDTFIYGVSKLRLISFLSVYQNKQDHTAT